ncbi:MAG: hypothetical protein U1F16_02190 [Turneriella sp.]
MEVKILLATFAIFLFLGLKVISQYEQGLVFTLGKFTGIKQLVRFLVPVFQRMVRVDAHSHARHLVNSRS